MNTPFDSVDYVSVVEEHTCPFHQIAPGEPYPSCTCSGSYSYRKATPEEREANIEARKQADERRAAALRAVSGLGSGMNVRQAPTESLR